ncbi:hypothetical protein SALBM311S_05284 [Streptomyces alboniger]
MSDQPRRPGKTGKPYRRPQKDPVRMLAFEALRAVDERDAYANLVLPPLLRKAREKGGFDGRDAALGDGGWCTGRCAGRGRTTPSSPPVSTGRCGTSTRPVLDVARTRSAPAPLGTRSDPDARRRLRLGRTRPGRAR